MAKRWTLEEETHLLELLSNQSSINDCASLLKRTEGAITARLQKIALDLIDKNLPIEDIHKRTTVPIDILKNFTLPNYNAEWDKAQDDWLKKYLPKLGTVECASRMGRSVPEIERRQLYYTIDTDDAIKEIMNDCIPLTDYMNVVEDNTHYYVVLNGRCKGIYKSFEGAKYSTINFKNAKYKKCKNIKELNEYIHSSHNRKTHTIVLSEEQEKVIEDVFQKKNILLLGSGGTGKSTLIKELTSRCKDKNIEIGITASTGSASVLIGGKTVHSFLGIGLAEAPPKVLASIVNFKYKNKVEQLNALDILLIDEISMINGELLTKISQYLSIIRNNELPFGGLQIILSGDMFQLPPVQGTLVFQSIIWDTLKLTKHILTKIFRQEHDVRFQKILERCKSGSITNEDIEILKNCKGQYFTDDIKPTHLYATNAKVDSINNIEYDLLNTMEKSYNTIYKNKETKVYCEKVGIPLVVKLKIGSQVMVTHNISDALKLANGTRGMVKELFNEYVIIQTLYGERKISYVDCETEDNLKYSIMPLKLAWAITIHKAQGVTLDCCKIDIGKSLFTYGQAYTALSRVKDLNSLYVIDISKDAFRTHPDVLKFYDKN
jgi:ATP-dependent DNA helicase PIF1